MQTFDWSFQAVAEGAENTSILATIAGPFAYVLVPVVGVLSWQLAAAAITGFIAKENVVGTMAVCFAATQFINPESLELEAGMAADAAGVMMGYDATGALVPITAIAGLAYMMFNLFTPPCFAAIGAMNAEIKDKKWLWGGIALQLGVGFTVAYLVYTVGTLIVDAAALPVLPAILGGVAVLVMVGIVVWLIVRAEAKLKQEYALSGKK